MAEMITSCNELGAVGLAILDSSGGCVSTVGAWDQAVWEKLRGTTKVSVVLAGEAKHVQEWMAPDQGAAPVIVDVMPFSVEGRRHVLCIQHRTGRDGAGDLAIQRTLSRGATSLSSLAIVEAILPELKSALDHHSIVAVADSHGVITEVNDAFEQVSGYARAELIGQTHGIIISAHHPHSFFVDIWEKIVSGRVWKGEICSSTKDGDQYWVLTTIMPLGWDSGRPKGYLAICTDVTELKRVQRENELKSREMEQLVYTVSHDLKSPIVTITGYLLHVMNQVEVTGDAALLGDLRRIQRATERMNSCVEDLLAVSRLGYYPLDPVRIDVNSLVREVRESLAMEIADAGAEFEIDLAVDQILFDKKQMGHLVQNLVQNAIRYGRRDGAVRVCIQSSKEPDGTVRLAVRDRGPGIPEAMRERVFALFQRLSNESHGTGVGLAIVRSIAERAGGRVTIEETPGGGASFIVSLPSTCALSPRRLDQEMLHEAQAVA